MAKIISVEEDVVFIQDNGNFLQINKELLNFEPRVNDFIIVFRDQEGTITRVILGTAPTKVSGMNSQAALMVFSIYSVIIGLLGLFALVRSYYFDTIVFVLSLLLVISGIAMLILKTCRIICSKPYLLRSSFNRTIGSFYLYVFSNNRTHYRNCTLCYVWSSFCVWYYLF
ncbi:MAG: hypothetical protein GX813_02745, partial [Erysipelotrichia bacterium]|nr:hypothetical protein [Erysipelotrichia bacterium]